MGLLDFQLVWGFNMHILDKVHTYSLVLVSAVVFAFISWTLSSISPSIQDFIVRSKTNGSIFILDVTKTSGNQTVGTGFQVENSKKERFILTNRHICENSKEIDIDYGPIKVLVSVIRQSKKHDLCVLSPSKTANPLQLIPTPPYLGQIVYVVGHPLGLNLTVSRGSLVGIKEDTVPLALPTDGSVDCLINGGTIIEPNAPPYGFDYTVCDLPAHNFLVTSPTRPGNSGSPTVTLDGDVIGIVSMKDEASWGLVVPYYQIQEFIDGGE